MSVVELYNSEYKNDIIRMLSVAFGRNKKKTHQLLQELFKKNTSDNKIFTILHKIYHNRSDEIATDPIIAAERRAKKRKNEIENIIKNIGHDSNKYLDIGCEECMAPLNVGEALGIKDVHCINISDWEESYGIDKSDMGKCNFKYYDGENVPYPDYTFSVISIFMVLHHIEPTKRHNLFKHIYRTMKKNGVLIIREHDSTGELMDKYLDLVHRYYDSFLLKDFRWIDNYGTYYQAADVWEKEIENHGFKSVKRQQFDNAARPYYQIFKKL